MLALGVDDDDSIRVVDENIFHASVGRVLLMMRPSRRIDASPHHLRQVGQRWLGQCDTS